MHIMRLYFFALMICAAFTVSAVHASVPSIEGLWATEGEEAVVQIYACDESFFCGRFYWLKDENPMSPSRDEKNPQEDKRERLLCGMKFLGGFEKQEEQGDYGSGWLYSPRHGARFSSSLRLLNQDELEMRGYLFVPFLGESQMWKRKKSSPACHFIGVK